MTTEQLNSLQQDTKSKILEVLHRDTFGNNNPNGSWDIIRKFYDTCLIHDVYFSDSNLLDVYSFSDSFDVIKEDLQESIQNFYNDNLELLSEKFSLNNNFYPVDLRVFIVDFENVLQQDKRDSEND